MNSKSYAVSTDLMCSECGEIQVIYRHRNNRPSFHIKDMWCPVCHKDVKFIELKDRDILYFRLLYKEDKNELEQFVFDNLESRRNSGKVKQLAVRK